jgi:glycosyltransferase involved in cell wall biosynthesis
MRFGAFVITYHRPKVLADTLRRLLEQSRVPDLILVVDNGASVETEQAVASFNKDLIVYHAMPENLGPAGAAAYALHWLVEQGYDWIYWGDEDDPPWFPDVFERLLHLVHNIDATVAAVGAVGAKFDWQIGESVRLPDQALTGVVEIDTIGGNSQMIICKEAIHTVGLPNPKLFFGYYEPEYCLRLRQAGYRLLIDGDLMQKYREKFNRLGIKPKRAFIPTYSYDTIWRQYYRTRNYIYMMRKTFTRPDLAKREALKALGRSLFSLARGPRYGLKFARLQIQAILDGYYGRIGCTIKPAPKQGLSSMASKPGS